MLVCVLFWCNAWEVGSCLCLYSWILKDYLIARRKDTQHCLTCKHHRHSHQILWARLDGGWRQRRNSQFCCSLCKHKKKNLNRKEHIYVLTLFLHRQRDREQSEQGMPETESKGEDSRREGQQMNIKLPCWGIYLRLLLGWRRSCCTAASAAAIAAPASSRWAWVTLVLLWLRDGPWERRWPSDEDFELPGLLWDFSMVGTCMSGYRRVETWVKVPPVKRGLT